MRWPDFFGRRAKLEVIRLEQMLAEANYCLANSTRELVRSTQQLEAARFQLGNEKRIWGYVTDEAIAEWAKKSPDEQTAQIAILTMKLARETAKVMEIEAARSELAMRLKNKRYNQADEMAKHGLPRNFASMQINPPWAK